MHAAHRDRMQDGGTGAGARHEAAARAAMPTSFSLAAAPAFHSITSSARKRTDGGMTTGPGTQVVLRCHEDFLAAVDQWRERQNGDKLTRARAISVSRSAAPHPGP